jgi:integrase
MPAERHSILNGKVHVYRRENTRRWQCSVYMGGKNHRATTGELDLAAASVFAAEWYGERCADDRLLKRGIPVPSATERIGAGGLVPVTAKHRRKTPRSATPLFDVAATAFYEEYKVLTVGERNAEYVAHKDGHLRLYLRPVFGKTPVGEITAGMVQAYRAQRLSGPTEVPAPSPSKRKRGRPRKIIGRHPVGIAPSQPSAWKRPARATLNSEIVTLRQVLKYANRQGWIPGVPDLSPPYRTSNKISRRAWFSPEEYKQLYTATRERAKNPLNERWRGECETLHDYVLFMANTGLRPDEASRIEYRDVKVVLDVDTDERILEISVRGKRGVGYCKSMPGAVQPLLRLRTRSGGAPAGLVFGKVPRELLNTILEEQDLKIDREGKSRTAYSLRHTYISMRLMDGADIYQVAKNCRTSVEMIEKFYAAHIVNTLDAAAINVRKAPKPRRGASAAQALADD